VLKFYYNLGPNPLKVALFLEEAGLPYEPVPIDVLNGEQFAPSYLAINPNGKTPALVDGDATIFDSNAILLYLAEMTGRFLPENTLRARGELLSWLMFVATGLGPFAGQAVHFSRFAPDQPYALNRYLFEAERHFKIVDARLEGRRYMLGDTYTLVDMAVWGWARVAAFALGEERASRLTHLTRLVEEINARPAAAHVASLKDMHAFRSDIDAEARGILFKHTVA
jgi:GSH-dependent disulfide-bond oxidoreductase